MVNLKNASFVVIMLLHEALVAFWWEFHFKRGCFQTEGFVAAKMLLMHSSSEIWWRTEDVSDWEKKKKGSVIINSMKSPFPFIWQVGEL